MELFSMDGFTLAGFLGGVIITAIIGYFIRRLEKEKQAKTDLERKIEEMTEVLKKKRRTHNDQAALDDLNANSVGGILFAEAERDKWDYILNTMKRNNDIASIALNGGPRAYPTDNPSGNIENPYEKDMKG